MRVATWNVEKAGPSSKRGGRIAAKLTELNADIMVVTEARAGVLPVHGHVIDAGDDWGCGREREQRKTLA